MKSSANIAGMKSVKSMSSTIKTPISGSRNSGYLELYMLEQSKQRLENECLTLDKRKEEILAKLIELKSQMKELKEKEQEKEESTSQNLKESEDKVWKTMKVDY